MKEISKQNAETLGIDILLFQIQEECGELIKAAAKYNRTRGIGQITETTKTEAYNKMLEEMTDVEIVLEQMKYLLKVDEKIDELKDRAFEKVKNRYEN